MPLEGWNIPNVFFIHYLYSNWKQVQSHREKLLKDCNFHLKLKGEKKKSNINDVIKSFHQEPWKSTGPVGGTNSCIGVQQGARVYSLRRLIPRRNYEVAKVGFSSIHHFVTVPFLLALVFLALGGDFVLCFSNASWMRRPCLLGQHSMVQSSTLF